MISVNIFHLDKKKYCSFQTHSSWEKEKNIYRCSNKKKKWQNAGVFGMTIGRATKLCLRLWPQSRLARLLKHTLKKMEWHYSSTIATTMKTFYLDGVISATVFYQRNFYKCTILCCFLSLLHYSWSRDRFHTCLAYFLMEHMSGQTFIRTAYSAPLALKRTRCSVPARYRWRDDNSSNTFLAWTPRSVIPFGLLLCIHVVMLPAWWRLKTPFYTLLRVTAHS